MRIRQWFVSLSLASVVFAGLAGGAEAAANPGRANCLGVGFSGAKGETRELILAIVQSREATGQTVGDVASLLATTSCGQR